MQLIEVGKIHVPEDIFIIEMPAAEFQKLLDKKDEEVFKTPKGNLYYIKNDKDFERVFKEGRRIIGPHFILYGIANKSLSLSLA